MDMHELEVAAVTPETAAAVRVQFALPPALKPQYAFAPGQYLTLEVDIDGAPLRRAYSICSAPWQPLQVAIKHLPDGRFSTYANRCLKVGERLQVGLPNGCFTAPEGRRLPVHDLCMAAGSGITPIMSIIRTTLAAHPRNRITLLYGNKTAASMMFRNELMFLKNRYLDRFHLIPVFSQELQDNELFNGRINNAKGVQFIKRLLPLASFDEFFLCGPESMISEVDRGLRAEGVAGERVHYELFSAAAEDAAHRVKKHEERARRYGSQLSRVTVRFKGRSHQFDLECDGENLLERARAQGLDVPFSCRDGVCATCKARLLKGQVDMDVNHALAAAEVAAGFILSCQSHPLSAQVSLDFDV